MLHTNKIRLFVSQCASWQTEVDTQKENPGKKGILDCRLHWYPKFCNLLVLFVDSKTLGNSVELGLVGSNL